MKTSKEYKIMNRLHSSVGESLSETLISLLVAALALTMLAGAISSSANVIKKGRNSLNQYYNETEKIVTMSGSGKNGTITIKDSSSFTQSESILYYENDKLGNTPVITYQYKKS